MSRIKDLTGKRFGKLLVISRGENDNMNRCTWNCQCDCGTVVNVKSANLVSGGTTSCGCNRVESLVGKKYGRLKVISREKNIRSESGRSHVMYMCQCDCGNYLVVKAENEARALIQDAQNKSEHFTQNAKCNVDKMLKSIEDYLMENLMIVRNNREELAGGLKKKN